MTDSRLGATHLVGFQLIYDSSSWYLIIYEIKYKTNVVTQSFMPEFTDNLRTTKEEL
jgi:hypothetical protein